jgi:hypothetical protein
MLSLCLSFEEGSMKKLKLFIILSLVISILLILTMFIPLVDYQGEASGETRQMAGLGIVFGIGSFRGFVGGKYVEIGLNGQPTILLLIAYILPIILSVLLLIFKNRNKTIGYVLGGLLIAAFIFEAIMIFNVTGISSCTLEGKVVPLNQANCKNSVGAYIGGVGALLGALSSAAYVLFKYLSSKEEK